MLLTPPTAPSSAAWLGSAILIPTIAAKISTQFFISCGFWNFSAQPLHQTEFFSDVTGRSIAWWRDVRRRMYDVIASSFVTLGVIGWSKSHERFSTPVNFLSIFSRSLARASFSLRSLLDLRHVSAASITYCSFYSFFFLVIEFFLSTEICSNF